MIENLKNLLANELALIEILTSISQEFRNNDTHVLCTHQIV